MRGVLVFFFKQKTAYEMLRSLVGSEMCIRDSGITTAQEGLMEENQFNILKAMANQNKLKMDVVGLSLIHI
ncbi:hypothetical protein CDFC105_31828 [Clostridioides difficile]|nr:hypothetical protein CDFC105_31828 [Clostridioides difficile]